MKVTEGSSLCSKEFWVLSFELVHLNNQKSTQGFVPAELKTQNSKLPSHLTPPGLAARLQA